MSDSLEKIALSNCDREPIHIPGRVQSFGSLLGFDAESRTILHHSDNLATTLPDQDAVFLGKTLDAVIPTREVVHGINGAMGLPTIQNQRERIGSFVIHGKLIDLSIFANGSTVVIEFEPAPKTPSSHLSSVSMVRSMMGTLECQNDLTSLLDSSAQALRNLTGHDRVMVYRFLDNGDGEVVAESKGPGIEPYLGLRYPASDIPVQVRQLMLRSTFRVIHDIDAEHSALVSQAGTPPLDMTHSHLRGVSPIHIEYLRNMGVNATMNTSIIVRGQLWGMFAFHHFRPRVLSSDQRSICEVFGSIASMRIQQEEENQRFSRKQRTRSTIASISASSQHPEELFEELGPDLMDLAQANGIAWVTPLTVSCVGDVPDENLIREICESSEDDTLSLESLSSTLKSTQIEPASEQNANAPSEQKIEASRLAKTAGVLRFEVGSDSYLAFFRNEIIHEIRWAGSQEKQISVGENGPRLTPRASFAEYTESVAGCCTAWSPADFAAASEIRREFMKITQVQSSQLLQKWDKQKQYQDLLIAELNHRVQNTLALVKSIARQTKSSTQSLDRYVDSLEQRIGALSVAQELVRSSGLQWARIEELVRSELSPFENASSRVSLQGPKLAVRADIAPIVSLLLHEMTSNAVKHGALSESGESLSVRWYEDADGVSLEWVETTKHPVQMSEKTGFGLALIERALPHECGGRSDIEFRPHGLRIHFWIPTDSTLSLGAKEDDWAPRKARVVQPQESLLKLKSALIVEDNMVLAMELEKILLDLGVESVAACRDSETAQEAIATHPFDCAVVDINLGPMTSLEIALELLERQIPIVLASGYSSKYDMPEPLRAVPRLTKPINRLELSLALQEACAMYQS